MKDSLDPDYSPDLLSKPKGNLQVKKLNKLPLLILILAVTVITFSLVFAILSRGKKNQSQNTGDVLLEEGTQGADGQEVVDGLLKKLQKEKKEEKERKLVTKVSMPGAPPSQVTQSSVMIQGAPPMGAMKAPQKQIDKEAEKLRKIREELLNNAILAGTTIRGRKQNTQDRQNQATDPRLAMDKTLGSSLGMLKDYLKGAKSQTGGRQEEFRTKDEQFIQQSKKSFRYTAHGKTAPISPYEIKTGTIIPATLLTGLNSELPGQMLAQVSENVYDTATGNYLLIPQGAKLIGEYNSGVAYGQNRLLAVWNRIVFPDGQTMNIGAMVGTDKSGYSGFADKVDNHYFKIFSSALLISLIGGDLIIRDGKLSLASGNADGEDRRESALEKTGTKMIEKNMEVAPTITVRPGYKFNVFVNQDMILEPLEY